MARKRSVGSTRVVLYGSGDLRALGDAVGDVAGVEAVSVLPDRIDLATMGAQELVPHVVELASLCDVEVAGVVLLPDDVRRSGVAGGAPAIGDPLPPRSVNDAASRNHPSSLFRRLESGGGLPPW